jgi:signal transduction histidine kinase/DNA-binding NarL/FixJ family response regulator
MVHTNQVARLRRSAPGADGSRRVACDRPDTIPLKEVAMKELNVLLLEDNPADAEVIRAAMNRGGLVADIKLASDRDSFLQALDSAPPFDVVLSDSGVPGYTGMSALKEVHERNPDLPFVFVSGTVDPTRVNAARTAGAFDVVGKNELSRLPHTVILCKQFEQMQRENARQKRYSAGWARLIQTIQSLTGASNTERIFELVRQTARALVACDGVMIALRDGEHFHVVEEESIPTFWRGRRLPLEGTIEGWVMRHRAALTVPDVTADVRISPDFYRGTFVKSLVVAPIRTEDPLGVVSLYWDRVRQPTAEEMDLLQALADITAFAYEGLQLQIALEQRVDERMQELDATRSDLENVAQWLLRELRAPLRQIETVVREQSNSPFATSPITPVALTIAHSSRQFDALAEGIGNFLRSGRTPLRREQIDTTMLVKSIWRELEEREGVGPELRLSLLPAVQADRALLRTVFQNILANARKFTRFRTQAVIQVTTETADDETVFVVTDNGVGCDLKKATRLFSMLQRYHAADEFPGAGAGLAIAQRIVQRHGGRIWAKSEPGEGMSIHFTLPYRERDRATGMRFSQR